MIIHTVNIDISNISAEKIYNFMIDPSDTKYSRWWPGIHLEHHIKKHGDESHLGDLVHMDEYLDHWHRLTFDAIVCTADSPNKIIWQMKKFGIRLPAFVKLADMLNRSKNL